MRLQHLILSVFNRAFKESFTKADTVNAATSFRPPLSDIYKLWKPRLLKSLIIPNSGPLPSN
jgi:hypothetical protein